MNHRNGFQTILDTHNSKAEYSVYNLFSLFVIPYLEKYIPILKHWSIHTVVLVDSHFLTCLSKNGNIVFGIERRFLYSLHRHLYQIPAFSWNLRRVTFGRQSRTTRHRILVTPFPKLIQFRLAVNQQDWHLLPLPLNQITKPLFLCSETIYYLWE